MASEVTIDHISYNGQKYEFADSVARSGTAEAEKKVDRMTNYLMEKVGDEKTRAMAAEKALEDSKISIVAGMGLSKNNFSDEHKSLVENPPIMTGATSTVAGEKGICPKPTAGDNVLFLRGDGTWAMPYDSTYDVATQSADGLMSHTDKAKLDNMEAEPDEFQSSDTSISNNTITETLGNGRVKTTTFNADGSILQVITKEGTNTIRLMTTFGDDGSVERVRV